jgi:hypothetical protein
MNTVSAFERAIDILLQTNRDDKAIVVELAKRNPDILVAIVDRLNGAGVNYTRWHQEAVYEMIKGNRVNAIKRIREATDLGLKEAKDIADNVNNTILAREPSCGLSHIATYGLTGELKKIHDQLVAAAFGKMPMDLFLGQHWRRA